MNQTKPKLVAIIPVAGAGTRLRPFTYTQPKSLIPIAGKPILSYIIDRCIEAGVDEFVFIIGYFGEKVVDYVESLELSQSTKFVMQQKRDGLGHAIYSAKDEIMDTDHIVIALGDSIIDIEPTFFSSKTSCIAIKKVKDPMNYGVAEFDDKGRLKKLVEKPKFPKSNEALVGWFKIVETAQLMQILEKYTRDEMRTSGEIQLTAALNEMLESGCIFESMTADTWLDVGNTEVLLQSNEIMLKRSGGQISTKIILENAVIIEPVSIADNCIIKQSIIGPNVTIGEHTIVENAVLNNGILGSYTQINKLMLEDFVVGSDSHLIGKAKSLTIGDNTEIDFGK